MYKTGDIHGDTCMHTTLIALTLQAFYHSEEPYVPLKKICWQTDSLKYNKIPG